MEADKIPTLIIIRLTIYTMQPNTDIVLALALELCNRLSIKISVLSKSVP